MTIAFWAFGDILALDTWPLTLLTAVILPDCEVPFETVESANPQRVPLSQVVTFFALFQALIVLQAKWVHAALAGVGGLAHQAVFYLASEQLQVDFAHSKCHVCLTAVKSKLQYQWIAWWVEVHCHIELKSVIEQIVTFPIAAFSRWLVQTSAWAW